MNPHLLNAISETPLFEGLSQDRIARAAGAFCVRSYDRARPSPAQPTPIRALTSWSTAWPVPSASTAMVAA